MSPASILPLDLETLVALASPATRSEARAALAAQLYAKDFLIFVQDYEAEVFLPAPGFPATLRHGQHWQSFLTDCQQKGENTARLELNDQDGIVNVLGVAQVELVAVVTQCSKPLESALTLKSVMPLLVQLFVTEHKLLLQNLRVQQASENARRATLLAESLEQARYKQAEALKNTYKARQALEETNERKDQFLAILAHELRNPLAPIGNCLEMLKLLDDSPQQRAEIHQLMSEQFHQMVRLIDDLMDVSRITRGKVELRLDDVCVHQIVRAAVQSAKPSIELRNHTLAIDDAEEDLWVRGDKDRLIQVIVNLLTNAAKYTSPGGRICLKVSKEKRCAVITVTDNGIGLPSSAFDKIFDMFVQLDPENNKVEKSGLGIGLTLVKQLVEMHKGEVSVFSDGLHKGTTFEIKIPLIQMDAEKDTPRVKNDWADCCSKLKVVVVDDNLESAKTLTMAVRLMGADVTTAHSGQEALEVIESNEPHVVLLDIGLPDIDGYEVCRTLKRDQAFESTVFIAQTGWSQPSDKKKSKESGFTHHLVKPLDFSLLKSILKEVSERRVQEKNNL